MRVFIYGTLKKDGCRGHVLDSEKFIKNINSAPKYTLFSVSGQYPALVESEKAEVEGVAVKGELWDVSDKKMLTLDSIEGTPYLYQRQEIELEDGSIATTYVFQRELDGLENVGDFWEN